MSPLEENLKKQLHSLKTEFETARAELHSREESEQTDRDMLRRSELYRRLDGLKEQIHDVEKKLEVLPMREAVHDVRRAARFEAIARHSVLVLGAAALISLAFIFSW